MERISEEEWLEMFPDGDVYEWNSTVSSSCDRYYLSHNYWPSNSASAKEDATEISSMIKESGYYSLYNNGMIDFDGKGIYRVMHLERLFLDPLRPTQVELELFKLEKGFDYLFPVGGR